MKNVLLLNKRNTDNLGDRAISETMHKLFEERNYNTYRLDISSEYDMNKDDYKSPMAEKKENNIEKKGKKSVLSFLKKKAPKSLKWFLNSGVFIIKQYFNLPFKKLDLVFVGGGQLILSYKTFDSFSYGFFLWYLLNKFFSKAPMVIFGVGAGDSYSKTAHYIYSKVLKDAKYIYVRDNHSKQILKDQFNVESSYVPDVAFSFRKYHSKLTLENKTNEEVALIGIYEYDKYKELTAVPLNQNDYLEYWAQKIFSFQKDNYTTKLFYTTANDMYESEKLKQFIIKKYNKQIEILSITNLEDLILEVSKANLVYSARMHALILGKIYDCKTIAYPLSNKLKSYDELYEQKDIDFLKLEDEINDTLDIVLRNIKNTN